MVNRRNFIKTTSAFTAGSLIIPPFSFSKRKIIGLQLYTVRDQLNQDLDGTLKRVAEIGYNSLEAAGYNISDGTFYGIKPKEFARKLKGLGMRLNSSHTAFEPDVADKVLSDTITAGCKYIVYPHLAEEMRRNIDDYRAVAGKLNKLGEAAKKHGILFGYHNHNFEFQDMGGQIGMDVLLAETDPSLVLFEIDLYWVISAGYDPVDYMKKHPGRFKLWHIKDMTKTDDKFFAPVGTGRIDFERIFAIKELSGMEMFFVEQDQFKNMGAFDGIKTSYDYLNNAAWV